jgi:hypothetical protein
LKNYKILLTTLLFSLLILQGCQELEEEHPPVIGSAISIGIDDKQAEMSPSYQALDEVSKSIATIIKLQINEISQQEISSFGQDIFFCDISGLKKWENNSTLNISYEECQTQEYLQNGELELTYEKSQEEWQHPQKLLISVKKEYKINQVILQKELTIESDIIYDKMMNIQNISFIATGLVDFDYQTIKLDSYPSTVEF